MIAAFSFWPTTLFFKNHLVVSSNDANGSLGGLCDDGVYVFLAEMGREIIVHSYQLVGGGGDRVFYFTIMI